MAVFEGDNTMAKSEGYDGQNIAKFSNPVHEEESGEVEFGISAKETTAVPMYRRS